MFHRQVKELFITTNFPPQIGGIEECVFNLCRYWQRSAGRRRLNLTDKNSLWSNKDKPVDNFKIQDGQGSIGRVVVLTQQNRDRSYKELESQFDREQDFQIIRRPLEPPYHRPRWLLSPIFAYSLARRGVVVRVHAASGFASFFSAYFLKRSLSLPYLLYAYGLDILTLQRSRLQKGLLKKIFKVADGFVANSNFTRNLMKRFYQEEVSGKVEDNKFLVLYPGVDTQIFKPLRTKAFVLKEKQGLKGKRVILSVGRIIERKGFDKVVESLPLILKRVPNSVYLIIGQGPFQKRLEFLAESLGVRNRVKFLGKISKTSLPYFYNLSDFFIMPSRFIEERGDVEGFGKVFLEANACEKAVIGGRSGGVPEAIVEGKTGLLVDPLDERDIAQKAIKLLKNKELAAKMGREGRKRVESLFRWERLVQNFQAQVIQLI